MKKYFIAVTYDVCQHEGFCEPMNQYVFNPKIPIEAQVKEFSGKDIAPLIKVYQSNKDDFQQLVSDKEFERYNCQCGQ